MATKTAASAKKAAGEEGSEQAGWVDTEGGGRDPKGGLTAAGRKFYNEQTGWAPAAGGEG